MKSKEINNELQMLLAFQRGQEKGFDFFYRLLFPSLCFFANRKLNNREEAEDIASQAFIKIWKRHSQFNNASNIRSYLYQIVRNDCLKYFQQEKRKAALQKDIEWLTIVDLADNIETDIIKAEFFGELYRTFNILPKECQRVFKMLYIQGKSVSEIASELNLSLSTVKTQKARGLAVLKKRFAIFLIGIFYHIF